MGTKPFSSTPSGAPTVERDQARAAHSGRAVRPARRWAWALALFLTSTGAIAQSIDSVAFIRKASELAEAGQHELARTYLAPALIDPRLGAAQRSFAYLLRGHSYYESGLPASASKDYARALQFDPANDAALLSLGRLYQTGEGVPRDPTLAFAFFERAAATGHAQGRLFMAYSLLEGSGVARDLARARELLEALAAEDDSTAMHYLGRSYLPEYDPEGDLELARDWLERAHAAGSPNAAVTLGYLHYRRELPDADVAEARRLFEAASEAGSSSADVALGHMFLTGDGVDADPEHARELLERAAAAGDMTGSASLGYMYEAGAGVKQDLERAEVWYRRGADAGVGQAQLQLFSLLANRGEEAEALRWLARAAEQGIAQAQNNYAWLLSTSDSEAERNGALALTLAERAVAQDPSATHLDTLAAAYAELGRFADAVSTQERALGLVTDAGSAKGKALAEHLEAYQAGRPWRE